jgi:hypothetical protein
MSAISVPSVRAPARRRSIRARSAVVLVLVSLGPLLASGPTLADPPPARIVLSAEEAQRSGRLISLLPHALGREQIVEVRVPDDTLTLLGVSSDGRQAVLAERTDERHGTLVVSDLAGAQLRVSLPGVIAAGFAPDGGWLAVVDGSGALWRVNAVDGSPTILDHGPFLGDPLFLGPAALVMLEVSSVEAPYRSRPVRLELTTQGEVERRVRLSDDPLVYSAHALLAGGLALITHDAGRTWLRRVEALGSEAVYELGVGAIHAAVAPDGARVAYERYGEGVFLVDGPGSVPRWLGEGSRPRFSTDASSLLVTLAAGTRVLGMDGSVLAQFDGRAEFAACGWECGS